MVFRGNVKIITAMIISLMVIFLLVSCSVKTEKLNQTLNGSNLMNQSSNQTLKSNITAPKRNLTYINLTTPEPPAYNTSKKKKNSTQAVAPRPSADSFVKIIDVDEAGTSCILSINGKTDVIYRGSSDTVDNITVNVLDVVAVHSQLASNDQCQLAISWSNKTG